MHRGPSFVFLLPALLLLARLPAPAAEPAHVAPTPPRTPADERTAFHLPPGFEAQLVASEPDIGKPIQMAFDARGRLWVTTSAEYPFAAKGRPGRDRLMVLDDIGPDGKAKKITTFADDLNIPIGLRPMRDGAIVYSIPHVLRLYDTKGTGKADRREVLYETFGHNDTHGMVNSFTLGFDGWLYASHGFSNTSTVKGKDGKPLTMHSGNNFRMKIDGSHVEIFSRGQVNPFGSTLDNWGNLFSADCHSRPITCLLRGAYYSSFGKPHDGLGYGPDMIGHDHGSTALCGLSLYVADHFPPEYRNTLFLGNVVTCRVNHDRLVWKGATPEAKLLPDFLVSDDPWFRPVDTRLGPDGALYIADFYNRIIGHYEVPLTHPGRDRERGRIWRIVYKGTDGKAKPPAAPRHDWTKATTAELIGDLNHPNLTVRMTAMQELVDRGRESVEPAREAWKASSRNQKAHLIWVLERLGALSPETLRAAATSTFPLVRGHAMRVLAERPKLTEDEHHFVLSRLKDADANVQRLAADALGRHPSIENVRPLLDLRHAVAAGDTHLTHTVRMALRDQLLGLAVWNAVPAANAADARDIADVSLGVPTAGAAEFLHSYLTRSRQPNPGLAKFLQHAARYGSPGVVRDLSRWARTRTPADLALQLTLFQAYQRGLQERAQPLSADALAWGTGLLEKALGAKDDGIALRGVEVAGVLRVPATAGPLTELAGKRERPEALRLAALAALANVDAARAETALGRVLADGAEAVPLREKAATKLAELNRPTARAELVQVLPAAPARVASAIAAGLANTPNGAEQLLKAIEAGKASPRLLQEPAVSNRLKARKEPKLDQRIARLTQGLPSTDQRLAELLGKRRTGFASVKADRVQGQKVFKQHCAACHQIGGEGAKIGPQLDGIGNRGVERVIEDLLDPNRNVDQEFRTTILTLVNGQTKMGLVLREEGQVVVMADAQGKEERIGKDQIEGRRISPLSPMPANFGTDIPEADFYHLLAYLLAQRATPPK